MVIQTTSVKGLINTKRSTSVSKGRIKGEVSIVITDEKSTTRCLEWVMVNGTVVKVYFLVITMITKLPYCHK